MGTRQLIGFDLEIMEPNFLSFSEQSAQYPAFVQPRPKTGDGNLKLERLLVVVNDIDATLNSLEFMFAPACRSKPYAFREGLAGSSLRIALGGIEIEYCSPSSAKGFLANTLARFGPGVAAIEFKARELGPVVSKATANKSVTFEEGFAPIGIAAEGSSCRLGCRALTGFDVVLTPLSDHRP